MRNFLPAVMTVFLSECKFKSRIILLAFLYCSIFPAISSGQAVTSIITDYNGWFSTASATPNTVKPSNNHNLLAFTYNGVQYSTGANDQLLNANGQSFSSQDFWALPFEGLTGTINGNTKVGVGQMYDGVNAGASNPPPQNDIERYLIDGTKGLNLGTCIANLPAGAMTFFVHNINPASIGDGVPDILVTQIADPSGSYDRYEFIDANNVRVGNYKDIIFTNITPVGTWTADFYEASTNPMVLAAGFTNTDRPLRLWAADLSEFGITAANYQSVSRFKINLSGNSDVAFAAYNNHSIQLTHPLPVRLTDFKGKLENNKSVLNWMTHSETENSFFTIEKSSDNSSFVSIGTVMGAGNSSVLRKYSFTDANPAEGNNYYRIKMTSTGNEISYSPVILIKKGDEFTLSVFPNPASSEVFVNHSKSNGVQQIRIINNAGNLLLSKKVLSNSTQTKIDITGIKPGMYFISLLGGESMLAQPLLIN
jgi:hypothetical protein